MAAIAVGSIVKCRGREWVVLPSEDEYLFRLRPLAGTEHESIAIHSTLHDLGLDRIAPAVFPLPNTAQAGDHVSVELLFNSARLTLRDGAGPFRSLGHISVRPRPYQFVPMLMALRLDPIRMLIADDVGVGKTVEALLIAREMLDRGEITRICIVCPPYLCSQWQKELWDKFRLEAAVVRSGTISRLERNLPSADHSIFGYYQHIIVSVDYAKSDAHRANFLQHAPKFVIVDEAHAATAQNSTTGGQQRFELLRDLAKDSERHLTLLTATPHSGVESAFQSLLGLLDDDFRTYNLSQLNEAQRKKLALHFVQRRRADVEAKWAGEETPFPKRDPSEECYRLSPEYQALFQGVYDFSRELVKSGDTLTGWKQRIRYWTALALLRCVMSSPAAAAAAIGKRLRQDSATSEQSDSEYSPYIFEGADEDTLDVQPGRVLEDGETELADPDRRRLRQFARDAAAIAGTDKDTKVRDCAKLVAQLLKGGFQPIVWCRYISTSDYVRDELQRRLSPVFRNIRVVSITGALAEDERQALLDDVNPARDTQRVLVATDCLSEGINLQSLFNSVIHYDLPWNPNRLEQREGRVDRFGQKAPMVKAILYYGRDNPVDGAVLDVLLRKARQIFTTLGVRVPVPVDSENVIEAVVRRLFAEPHLQMNLFSMDQVADVHGKWDRAAQAEKVSRTRFAQHAINPEEVEREMRETDAVLADPATARRFLVNASQRLNMRLRPGADEELLLSGYEALPEAVQHLRPATPDWRITFKSVSRNSAEVVDRNHPFFQGLAQYLMEEALADGMDSIASRAGVIRTASVHQRTWLLLCRLRYSIGTPGQRDLLAEEVQCFGFTGTPANIAEWLAPAVALNLLRTATPETNVSAQERDQAASELLPVWDSVRKALDPLVIDRAKVLETAHRRVRASVRLARRGMSVARHYPPDLLGFLALIPVPKGVQA